MNVERRSTLILASASPRRRELMAEHGYAFTVVVPPEDDPESCTADTPAALAEALSLMKARSVAETVTSGVIIAGDTVAALGSQIFGKPCDRQDAARIIRSLAGTTHDVISAVTLLDASSGRHETRHDRTAITMKSLSDGEIEEYLSTGAWQGKAGAYGIQDHGDAFVTAINGSFTNVVGFPMELVKKMLAAWNIHPG